MLSHHLGILKITPNLIIISIKITFMKHLKVTKHLYLFCNVIPRTVSRTRSFTTNFKNEETEALRIYMA